MLWGGQADSCGFLREPEPCFLHVPRLQDARQKFRSVLVEATVKLDELLKKIGKAVEDSKPYWEARRVARQVSQPARCPPASARHPRWRAPSTSVSLDGQMRESCVMGHSCGFVNSCMEVGLYSPPPPPSAFVPALDAIPRGWVLAFGCPVSGRHLAAGVGAQVRFPGGRASSGG